jgi:hypothetical protein
VPGDDTPADILSGRLITVRADDPLEYRGTDTGDISRSGVQIPPSPLRLLRKS